MRPASGHSRSAIDRAGLRPAVCTVWRSASGGWKGLVYPLGPSVHTLLIKVARTQVPGPRRPVDSSQTSSASARHEANRRAAGARSAGRTQEYKLKEETRGMALQGWRCGARLRRNVQRRRQVVSTAIEEPPRIAALTRRCFSFCVSISRDNAAQDFQRGGGQPVCNVNERRSKRARNSRSSREDPAGAAALTHATTSFGSGVARRRASRRSACCARPAGHQQHVGVARLAKLDARPRCCSRDC